MKSVATILCLFAVAIIPVAADAGQMRTPTMSTPHVNVGSNVSSTTPANVGSNTPKAAGKVKVQDLHITKSVDKSSP